MLLLFLPVTKQLIFCHFLEESFNQLELRDCLLEDIISPIFAQKVMQIKYPIHRNAVTWERAQQIKEKYTYVATDYLEELGVFASNSEEANKKTVIFQLPFTPVATVQVSEEEKKRKQQLKVEQGLRLKDMAEKKRKEKSQEKEEKLVELEEIKKTERDRSRSIQEAIGQDGNKIYE